VFYLFNQNSTFGYMVRNEDVDSYVFVEADSYAQAKAIAKAHGVYFDGCAKGIDCPCCGDRWVYWDSEGFDVPTLYDEPINEFHPEQQDADSCVAYFANGTRGYARSPHGSYSGMCWPDNSKRPPTADYRFADTNAKNDEPEDPERFSELCDLNRGLTKPMTDAEFVAEVKKQYEKYDN